MNYRRIKKNQPNLEIFVRRQLDHSSVPYSPLRTHLAPYSLHGTSITVCPNVDIHLLGRVTIHMIKETKLAKFRSGRYSLEVPAHHPSFVAVFTWP